jgi:hypothetical protein
MLWWLCSTTLAEGKIMDRRSALWGMLFLATAPAIIKIDTLMKLKSTNRIARISSDLNIEYSAKIIRHVGDNDNTYSLLDLYEWLKYQFDEDAIVNDIPIVAETPQIIELKDSFRIDAGCAEHITDGTIIQGDEVYTNVLTLGELK